MPSSSLHVDGEDDQPVVAVAGGEAVHQREFVLARRAPGRHEVDPDRLAAQVREVDRAAADLGHDERRSRLADVERPVTRRWPTAAADVLADG